MFKKCILMTVVVFTLLMFLPSECLFTGMYNNAIVQAEELGDQSPVLPPVPDGSVQDISGNPVSGNANLSGLVISNGTLVPAFVTDTTSYTVSVGNDISSITVTPTAEDSNAAVKVNNVAVASGIASEPINLSVGNNTLTILVTAQDGTTKTYTVTVTREEPEASSNANLSSLQVSPGELGPGFAADKTSYMVFVGKDVEKINITATLADNTATMKIKEQPAANDADNEVFLNSGVNNIDIVVTAQDGAAQKTYRVIVYREPLYSYYAKKISAGTYLTVALKSNGTVATWGTNEYGQLDLPEGLSNVVAVSAGNLHTVALKSDGTVAAWGQWGFGAIFVPEGLSNVVAVSAGTIHTVALKFDGTVTAWGDNEYGQCDVPAGLNNVVAVSAGKYHTAALKSDGTLVVWGAKGPYNNGQCNVPAGLKDVVAVSAENFHTIALKSDGKITIWGDNNYGQCDVPAGLNNVVAIEAGDVETVVLKSGGTVAAWGRNNSGQCDVPAGLSNVVAISTGEAHTVALQSDGSIVAWGNNDLCHVPEDLRALNVHLRSLTTSSGTLAPAFGAGTEYTVSVGNDISSITVTPTVDDEASTVTVNNVPVTSGNASQAIALDVGENTITIVIRAPDGTLRTYKVTAIRGDVLSDLEVNPGALGPEFASYKTSYMVFVGNDVENINIKATLADNAASMEINGQSAESGVGREVFLNYGVNNIDIVVTAQDGVTKKTYKVIVYRETLNSYYAKRLSAGYFHNVALKSDGTVAAWGGLNEFGQLNVPTGLGKVVAVSAGDYHTIALKSDGTVAAWGYNNYGQCNVPAGLRNVVAVSARGYNTVALKSDGTVVVWGACFEDVLGIGLRSYVPAGLRNVVAAISAERSHTVVLKSDGTVKAWGYDNLFGECDVPYGLSNVVAISTGMFHILALKSDGTLVTWGDNRCGQCDVPAGLNNVVAVSAGTYFTVALKSDGTVVTWGDTSWEQCDVPAGLSDVVAVSSGVYHTLALKSDGTVVAWGDNLFGQRDVPEGLRIAISDVDLSSLAVSEGTLSPSFGGGITSYTVNVGNNVNSIMVTPTAAAPNAVIKANGEAVDSGSASEAINLNVGNNTITILVTAQDGTTKTYTVKVTRAKPSDANLRGLTVSIGTLDPAFAVDTTSYTVRVENNVSSITVTPTVDDAAATVTVNGGNASEPIALNVGENTITILVTAQDGATTKTYTVKVTRAKSSNAYLSGLTVSSGTLTPGFGADTEYTVSVGNDISSITVTPTVDDATATVTVNSGSTSDPIALNAGENTITILVTAQDETVRTYTVKVTRAKSSNANLSGLTLSSGTLNPVFAAGTTSYTVSVGNDISSITVTPAAAEPNSTVKVNNNPVNSGNASDPITLNVRENTITILVTAQDGTAKTYTVKVTRAKSSNANLNGLTVSIGALDPAFRADITSYTVSVGNNVSLIKVTPAVEDAAATVTVNGEKFDNPIDLINVGENTITILVTAQDGTTTKTYTVTVTRAAAASSNANLSGLILSSGTLDPAFGADTEYTVSVGNDVSSITVTPKVDDAAATVTVNGGSASEPIALNVGENTITILVTAQDGTTTKTYTVIVTRITLPVMGGTASITGTTKFGQTLTADISSITYTPAAPAPADVPTYQWKSDEVDIPGATSSTYTLAEADIGKTITVTVSADGTHATGSMTSAETAAIDKADGPSAPAAPTVAGKTDTSVTLNTIADCEYSKDGTAWQDSTAFNGLTASTAYTFYARVKETSTTNASAASGGTTVDVVAAAADTYTVTFKDWDGSVLKTETIEEGDNATAPADPMRDGYTFTGWDKGFSSVTSDLTVTAQYNKNQAVTYTVTYDGNGGTGTAPTESNKAAGATFAAAENSITAPEGKWFKEWNTNSGGTGTSYLAGATVTMPANNLILYAIWEDIPAVTYTVSFNTNGGSTVDSQAVADNETAARPADPAKTGCTFIGWYSDSSLTTVFDLTAAITADTVVYAKWAENPAVLKFITCSSGNKIILTFNKAMADPTGNTGNFSASVNNGAVNITGIALETDTKKIDLALGAAVNNGDTITISYTPGTVASAEGGLLGAFSGKAVTNYVPVPITSNTVTVEPDKPNQSITSSTPDAPITITIPDTVENAGVNIADLLNTPQAGSSTVTSDPLPELNVSAAVHLSGSGSTVDVQMVIPQGTTVSVDENDNWDGTITMPTVVEKSSVAVTSTAGTTAAVETVIEVGYGDVPLTFNKAVRILIPGQAGKKVGYSRNGVFTSITTVLSADNQNTADAALPENGDGYINVGSDLVIWTKHFTKFVTYTESPVNNGGSDGSGDSGSSAGGTIPQTPTGPEEAPSPLVSSEIQGGRAITVQASDGTYVTVQANSVSGTVVLTISKDIQSVEPDNPNIKSYNFEYTERTFGPEGTVFDAPVTINIPFSEANIDLSDIPNLAIYLWQDGGWVKVGGVVDAVNKTVSIPVSHFSTYRVMADKTQIPERIAGNDRYDTAVEIAKSYFSNGADTVILARGDISADALTAVPLSRHYNAPLLLTPYDKLPQEVLDEIKALGAKNVIIMGGEGAISSEIAGALTAQGLIVDRISGTDRYDTAYKTAQKIGSKGKAIIVNGNDDSYADALSISSWAAYNKVPILYSDGTDTLPEATLKALDELKVTETILAGGFGVLPEALESKLSNPVRYGGGNRFDTNAKVLGELQPKAVSIFAATGNDFADALAGAAAAGQSNAWVILTDNGGNSGGLTDSQAELLRSAKGSVLNCHVFGGSSAVSDNTLSAVKDLLGIK